MQQRYLIEKWTVSELSYLCFCLKLTANLCLTFVNGKPCWSGLPYQRPACAIRPFHLSMKMYKTELQLYKCNPINTKPMPDYIFLKYDRCPEKLTTQMVIEARQRWKDESRSRLSTSPRFFSFDCSWKLKLKVTKNKKKN